MEVRELLHHPAVQAGLAPFLAALITAELLQRLRLSGLAIVGGFAATVYLAGSFSFEPFTATRKAVLLGLLSPLLAIALSYFSASWLRPLLAAAGGAAALWVMQRILQQQALPVLLLWTAAVSFYCGWLVYWMDGLEHAPVRAGSAGLALGLGTGVSALFGASAILGMYGMALGAASGAYLLIQMLTNQHLPAGRIFTLPLSLTASLLGGLAALTAELPWYALLPLAIIPLAARAPVSEKSGVWIQSILLNIVTMACAAVSVYLTWRVAGAPPL